MKKIINIVLGLCAMYLSAQDSTATKVVIDGRVYSLAGIINGTGGTDDQTLSVSGTDLSISNGNTVDLSGLGGGSSNPDVLYVNRESGDVVTNAWADSLGSEIINSHTSIPHIAYYNIPSSFDTYKRVVVNPIVNTDVSMIFTSDNYAFRGNGTAYLGSIPPNPTNGYVGVCVDSSNVASFSRITPISNALAWNGYFKPYSISQVTGLASSNITTTGFDISWDAATASVGTISDYQYSIDGATPVAVNGATSASVTGLTENTAYNVNVRAVDAGGNVGQYSVDLEVTAGGAALYQGNNAADPVNEVNGVANTTSSNSTVTSSSVQAQSGSYSIRVAKNTAASNNLFLQTQGITAGDSVTVTAWIYRTSGNIDNIFFWLDDAQGWVTDVTDGINSSETGVWVPVSVTGVAATDNPNIRVNDTQTGAATNIFFVDTVSYTIN